MASADGISPTLENASAGTNMQDSGRNFCCLDFHQGLWYGSSGNVVLVSIASNSKAEIMTKLHSNYSYLYYLLLMA